MVLNISYLAGIIDGEGTISVSGNRKQMVPYISISNTNKNLLNKVSIFLKTKGVSCTIVNHGSRKGNHKNAFSLRVRWDSAIKLARMLDGNLIIKSKQCKILAREFKSSTPRNGKYTPSLLQKKIDLISKLRFLNSRGV